MNILPHLGDLTFMPIFDHTDYYDNRKRFFVIKLEVNLILPNSGELNRGVS